MKNILVKKIKKLSLDKLNKDEVFKKPIKVIKKIRLHKLKNITSFSVIVRHTHPSSLLAIGVCFMF